MTEKTALILVDVINSFFEPGHPNYYPGVEDVIAPMRALLDAARRSGAIVVHAAEKHRPDFHDFEWKKLPVHHLADAHDAAFFPGFEPEGSNETTV
ncbi:cysteine hydrolase family protein, partial [Rhizobiaceae sp. 2RAB30]